MNTDAAIARARRELADAVSRAPNAVDLHAHLQAVLQLLEECGRRPAHRTRHHKRISKCH